MKVKNRFPMKNDYSPTNCQKLTKLAAMLAALKSYIVDVERLFYVNYIARNELNREKL
jgi:hypothetical protein